MTTPYATGWENLGNIRPEGEGAFASGAVPAGTTTPSLTHGLGSRDVSVTIRDADTGLIVLVPVETTDDDTVRLTFAAPPVAGQYRYLVIAGSPTATSNVAPHASDHYTGGSDPLTPGNIGAAPSGHTHTGYAASAHTHTPQAVGAAPVNHTHPTVPALRGPWTRTSGFDSFSLGPSGNRPVGDVTVPALDYDWVPFCSARYCIRSDIARPSTLELAHADGLGIFARGTGPDTGREQDWPPTYASPVFGTTPLPGNTSHTFTLRAGATGAWVESTTSGEPYIVVYAIPVQ